MTSFGDFLKERLESGGFSTEDVLTSVLPLMRQVIETHGAGMVAPLDGIESLRVERSAVWFEESSRVAEATDPSLVRKLDRPLRSGVEAVGEHSRTVDVGEGVTTVADLSIGESGDEVTRPVYLPGYRSWEHVIGHHDPLVDVFSLGLILASVACGLDLRDPDDLRSFVAHRKNLFALNPGLHPVLAKAAINMTELSRHRRPQDLRSLMRSLENYRDQEINFDLHLASIEGFGERNLPRLAPVLCAGANPLDLIRMSLSSFRHGPSSSVSLHGSRRYRRPSIASCTLAERTREPVVDGDGGVKYIAPRAVTWVHWEAES